MEILKKLLENLGINEETFKNTFAIIIEAGGRLKRIEEKQDEIIMRLTNQTPYYPQSVFEKQDESGELVSVKFDDAIENDGLQRNVLHDNVVTLQSSEASDIQTSTSDGNNPNIGKS